MKEKHMKEEDKHKLLTADSMIAEGQYLIQLGTKMVLSGEALKQTEPPKKAKRIPLHKDPVWIAHAERMMKESQRKSYERREAKLARQQEDKKRIEQLEREFLLDHNKKIDKLKEKGKNP